MLALASALASFVFALPAAVQAPQFELQLVRADAGPVAGAQVRWFEGEAPRDDLGAFEAAALASGKLALADERGRVVIEGARERVNIAASLPGWWGFAFADKPEAGVHRLPAPASSVAPPTLVLHHDRNLVFETVGGDGARVGNVPVVLRSGLSSLRASSGADGAGVIPHAGVWWEHAMGVQRALPGAEQAGRVQLEAKATLEVESIPRAHRRPVALGEAMPTAPVVFSVDGLEEVLLTVRTTADVAPLDGGWVHEPFDKTRVPLVAASDASTRAVQARLWLQDGHAPVELFVRRNEWSATYPFSVRRERIAAGQAEVQVGEGHQTIRVRPRIDGQSRPLTQFEALRDASGDLLGLPGVVCSHLTSDADGDVRVDIARGFRQDPLVIVQRSGARRDHLGVLDFNSLASASIDVVLAPRSKLTVELVDDRGMALANALAQVDAACLAMADLPSCTFGLRSRGEWPVESHFLDENGRTTVFRSDWDYADLSPLRSGVWEGTLSVSVAGFIGAESRFTADTQHLRMVLPRAAKISGRVRSARADQLAELSVLLLRREEGVPEKYAPGVDSGCGRDGHFEFPSLRAAGDQAVVPLRPSESYTLIVRRVVSGAQPVELTRREGLYVGPGATLEVGEIVID